MNISKTFTRCGVLLLMLMLCTALVSPVAAQSLSLSGPVYVNEGESVFWTLTLSVAPSDDLEVTLTSDDSGKAAVTPLTLTVPGGNSSYTNIQVIGVARGLATITAKASGYAQDSLDITVAAAGTLSTIDRNNPSIAVDENDNILVAWNYNFTTNLLPYYKFSVIRKKGTIGEPTVDNNEWIEFAPYGDSGWVELDGDVGGITSDSMDPKIAGGDDDEVYVVWTENQNPKRVYFMAYQGSDFEELDGSASGYGLSDNDGDKYLNAKEPAIAIDTDGNPVVAYVQEYLDVSDFNNVIYAQYVAVKKWNGSAWVGYGGSDDYPGVSGSSYAQDVDLVVDSQGRPHVTWNELLEGTSYIRTRVYNGSVWGAYPDIGGAPFAESPRLAIDSNDVLFITWLQYRNAINYRNVHAAYYSGGWNGMSGSDTFPGVSGWTNMNFSLVPQNPDIAVGGGRVYVTWQAEDENAVNNSILVKYWQGGEWSGSEWTPNTEEPLGLSSEGGKSEYPFIDVDSGGQPYVIFKNLPFGESLGFKEFRTLVIDKTPPDFDGIQGAALNASQTGIDLVWNEATDNVTASSGITYFVYRTLNGFSCNSTNECDPESVFESGVLMATVVGQTSYVATGLSAARYCFGVRAQDEYGRRDDNQVTDTAGLFTGSGDSDGDHIDNATELSIGTEPCNVDSDGDGMHDGWENFYAENAFNTFDNSLDPLDAGSVSWRAPGADPDNDGLSNLEEFNWWLLQNGGVWPPMGYLILNSPHPFINDTDGDGMPDGWEVKNGLNPVVPSDAAEDPDGDGVSNLNEYLYDGNPLAPDSDLDGVPDGVEILNGTSLSLADTDLDGLDDNFEVTQFGTDPLRADSFTNSFLSDSDIFQLGYTSRVADLGYTYLMTEDFETGGPGWTHEPANFLLPDDFWHITTTDPAPKDTSTMVNAVYMDDHSPNQSYRMANDPTGGDLSADYSVGRRIEDILISPVLDASLLNNLFVEWKEYYETEIDNDFIQVEASGDGVNWDVVSTTESGNSGGWTSRRADMSQFAGSTTVRVRFKFTTKNTINNDFPGWWVDDVAVYGGTVVTGMVYDINAKPLDGAIVYAIGYGHVTNIMDGHAYVKPGKIFDTAMTDGDGRYMLRGLPRGKFYLKATHPLYKGEFHNGPLFVNSYGFGNELNAGVFDIDDVTQTLDLLTNNAFKLAYFELEKGKGKAHLAVVVDTPAGAAFSPNQPVYVGQLSSAAQVWNGQANASAALVTYNTQGSLTSAATNSNPDWVNNPVQPNMLDDLTPGENWLFVGSALDYFVKVDAREGETYRIMIRTNDIKGSLKVQAADGGNYSIVLDGKATGSTTPATLTIRSGDHWVSLDKGDGSIVGVKWVDVPSTLGISTSVLFSTDNISGLNGVLNVMASDVNGNLITGAVVYINGQNTGLTTPATLSGLRPGIHNIVLADDGNRVSSLKGTTIFSGQTNALTVYLYQADRDYDLVGDYTEVESYGNIFSYSRDDDPDGDGLSNLLEFDVLRLYGVFMNAFNADSDGDGLNDGSETGFDGNNALLALTKTAELADEDDDAFMAYFVGRWLEGVSAFGTNGSSASIEGDLFYANSLTQQLVEVANGYFRGITTFGNINAGSSDVSLDQSHEKESDLYADCLPGNKDTDGDGMWDGFEANTNWYNPDPSVVNILHPLEADNTEADPDFDGLNNLAEFRGVNGVADTNDWTSPIDSDTDDDDMPDGWEYSYGLNPRDSTDRIEDPDGDGLVNYAEYLKKTDPYDSDTDSDFISDGDEVLIYMTDPLDYDTDGDGLIDGREVKDKDLDGVVDGGFFPNWAGGDMDGDDYMDGPTDWDTDGDGMPDSFEVVDWFGNAWTTPLDPMDPNDAALDPDGDGLTSLQEYMVQDAVFGNHPGDYDPSYAGVLWSRTTDPNDADTDNDGMPDGWEVEFGLHPSDPLLLINDGETNWVLRHLNLAQDGDLDSDGLWNIREFRVRFLWNPDAGSNTYDTSTNPWDADTDDDGLVDGDEDRAFRTHPVLQDTDGDGLADGIGQSGKFGEVWSTNVNKNRSYDMSFNDTWMLDYASGVSGDDAQPIYAWFRVPDINAPSGRWGMAHTYIPVYEISYQENTNFTPSIWSELDVLMDNRKLVIIGGQDGVTKFDDVWELNWHNLTWSNTLTNAVGAFSEHKAITAFGYESASGGADTNFPPPIPVRRPWWSSEVNGNDPFISYSYDYTYIFGGWDQNRDYYSRETVIKTADDPRNGTAYEQPASVEWTESYTIPTAGITRVFGLKGIAMAYDYTGEGEGSNVADDSGQTNDTDNGVVVIFGGMNGKEVYDTTYLAYPGGTRDRVGSVDPLKKLKFTITNPSNTPPARWGHQMAYDEEHDHVFMFGGFDENNAPLNDFWFYSVASNNWSEIRPGYMSSNQWPRPRGGHSMVYFGGFDYDRGWNEENGQEPIPHQEYTIETTPNHIVLFGGTDGDQYFGDTWIYDHDVRKWVLVIPEGENNWQTPPPRAFAAMEYAQNLVVQDYDPDEEAAQEKAGAAILMFGGRGGTLPTSKDTDRDWVDDGIEHALGGPGAGRDPAVNALIDTNSPLEVLPYNYVKIGSVYNFNGLTQMHAVANMEALSYQPHPFFKGGAILFGHAWQGHKGPESSDSDRLFTDYPYPYGVDGFTVEDEDLWYHRFSYDDPVDERDQWELGRPVPQPGRTNDAPPYAYSGRWCYGTDLDGLYTNGAYMELYSPMFSLKLPAVNATSTDYSNSFFLVFHEWLDLADGQDNVKVEGIRPVLGSEIANRRSHGANGKDDLVIVSSRNSAYNTTGQWRRVIAPLNSLANEENLFLRFTMETDSRGQAGGWFIDDVAIVQGSEIDGQYIYNDSTNNRLQVALFGGGDNSIIITSSLTRADGYFNFGLLPSGNYSIGSLSSNITGITLGPVGVGLTDYNVQTNSVDFNAKFDLMLMGCPKLITFESTPGVRYILDKSFTAGGPYTPIYTITAGGTNTIYYDYEDCSSNAFYRLRARVGD